MIGFTGDIVNGHKVFEREEFENTYWNYGELDRIEVLTGVRYASLGIAIDDLYVRDESLVYRNYSTYLDSRLRDGSSGYDLWIETPNGWVHKVTGELVRGCRPSRDSYPCWCTRETDPMTNADRAEIELKAGLGLLTVGIMVLAALFDKNGEGNEY